MNQKMQVSVHEAGHYIIAKELGLHNSVKLHKNEQQNNWEGYNEDKTGTIKAINKKMDSGITYSSKEIESIKKILCVLCAGKVAEKVYCEIEKSNFGDKANPIDDSIDKSQYEDICINVLGKRDEPFWNQKRYNKFVEKVIKSRYDYFKEIFLSIYRNEELD